MNRFNKTACRLDGHQGISTFCNGQRYPPKYVVAKAAEFAAGQLLDSEAFGGGKETNRFLAAMGFTVVDARAVSVSDRSTRTSPITAPIACVFLLNAVLVKNHATIPVRGKLHPNPGDALLVLLFLLSCTPTDVREEKDAKDTDIPDTGTPWWVSPEYTDADNDGYSLADGDCNDLDADVHPGMTDTCDGMDSDCDGVVDGDVDGDLAQEKNLGDLTETPEWFLYPMLFPETDVDSFEFYIEDEFTGYFDIEVWLYQVPMDADYRMELYWIEDSDGDDRGLVQAVDDNGAGGFEEINYGGLGGRDDSGWYRVVIESNGGASCISPYQLQFLIGGW